MVLSKHDTSVDPFDVGPVSHTVGQHTMGQCLAFAESQHNNIYGEVTEHPMWSSQNIENDDQQTQDVGPMLDH